MRIRDLKKGAQIVLIAQIKKSVICVTGGHYEHAHTRRGCYCARDWKGLATARSDGAGARKRGALESPVFCAAKNAPK
jgi:hypothetical protein